MGEAGRTMGRAADKAKTPLIAGGAAAVAGMAGGMALGMRQSRRSKLSRMRMPRAPRMPRMPRRPRVKVKSSDLASAAKDMGTLGAQMGQLASELRKNREEADRSKRRSPIEVVLQGLTSRR
jgi:hypothetical protein